MHERATPTEPDASSTGSAPWGQLTLADKATLPNLGDAQFASIVFERAIPHTAEVQWATTATSLDAILPHALTTVRAARMRSALADLEPLFGDRTVALVTLRHGTIHALVAAAEQALIADIEEWLRETFPVLAPTERQELPVRFWSCGAHGANAVSRTIDVPSFAAIETNYPRTVRSAGRTDEL